LKQIILITDGCSNVGINPVAAAAHANSEGLVVNVIGLVDDSEIGERGAEEIARIAQAGGGMSRLVSGRQLSRTIQMVTRKTVAHTIEQAVHQELKQLFGHACLEELPPGQRAEVVGFMEELGETTELRIALLIDCSASMKPKLSAVREAIRDLMLSLQARPGRSEISVLHFPGAGLPDADLELDVPWTTELAKLDHLFYKLNMKGTTPTGPAILKCVQYINEGAADSPAGAALFREGGRPGGTGNRSRSGWLGDYVV
jgi:Ca-activated chloride channel family protein